MNGYVFFRSLRMLLGVGLMVLVGLGAFVGFICSQLSLENRFRHNYGADWRVEYEKRLRWSIAMQAWTFVVKITQDNSR